MKSNLFEHRPTVVTVEAITQEMVEGRAASYLPIGEYFVIGNLKVTDTNGNVSYVSVEDFEANYKPKSPIKELGNMKLPNYPGSTVKIFWADSAVELETRINEYFSPGLNALVLNQQYWTDSNLLYASFTLNTVVDEDELKERTEIQKLAAMLWEEKQQERAEANRTALEIARKLTTERQQEEARKRKQLEEDAELGRKCRHNHSKIKGKK